jgi:hypothetical protein
MINNPESNTPNEENGSIVSVDYDAVTFSGDWDELKGSIDKYVHTKAGNAALNLSDVILNSHFSDDDEDEEGVEE